MGNEQCYRPDVRVRLIGEEPFFGPGTAALLRGIQQCGSVAAACENMGLSYSKGRNMIRVMEKELGVPIVRRSKGGVGGGNAEVTAEGEKLLEVYACYVEQVKGYAQQAFGPVKEWLGE